MSVAGQAILDHFNADNWMLLYRCRWSKPDAERIVPELTQLFESSQTTQEALRAIYRIGLLAVCNDTLAI